MTKAKGSNPFALATVALVFFFCLKGLYISSTSDKVLAISRFFIISSVNFPWFSIEVLTSSFLSSKFLKYFNLSSKFLNISLAIEVVLYFLVCFQP